MRIVSYNIQDGGAGRESFVQKAIAEVDADILILQEATNRNLIQEISAKQGMHFYMARGNSRRNIALLSKYRLSYFNSFHIFPLKHTLLEAKLEKDHREISFFGVHLSAYPFLLFETWRLLEIHIILSRINRLGAKNIIMCGDFNSVAPNDTVLLGHIPRWMRVVLTLTQRGRFPRYVIRKVYEAGLLDCHKELNNNDAGYTLLATDPHIRLDYFFISQSLKHEISRCQVIGQPDVIKLASDHLPILLEIEI